MKYIINNVEVYLRYESSVLVFFVTFKRIRFLESSQNLCILTWFLEYKKVEE
jgi:hypothetical protein